MKTLLGCASLLFLQALLAPLPVSAQQPSIFYVNRTDPTCGGQSPCFTTIQAAINAADPGNVVHIQAGTYPEQLSITGKNNFQGATEVDRIVIEADPAAQPGQVVLTGPPGGCTGNHAIRFQQSKFITIRGLTITGTGGQAISLLGGNNQNQDIHIELNRIFGNGSGSCNGGITVARGNPGTLIVNNLIHANGRNGITFIDADGGPHYLINNTIYGNQWNGVDVARNHTITLANNIINNNGTAFGTTGGRFGVRRESSTTPQPAGIKLLNNLVCGNPQGEISAQVLGSTDSSNYTPLGNEGTGAGALPGCELPANLFGNLNGSDNQPNTVDDDFSLKANSLAIDVGMDPRTLGFNPSYNPIFEADFVIEGIRPADGNADRAPAFDAGAFEFPNAPPVANAGANQTVSTNQLVTLNGTQSSDPEGTPLTYQWSIVSQPAGSSIPLNGANAATPTFTPLVAGQYIFQLVVNDGQFASAPSTVVITAVGTNQAPAANNTSASTDEDSPVVLTLSGSDVDHASLSFSIVGNPTHGTLGAISAPNCVADGSGSSCTATVTYTPAANYGGADSFTFNVNDGGLDSNVATVSITTNAVNDPPVASNIVATTNEDVPVNITLSASDVDNTTLTFAIVNGPSNGSLSAISAPNCVASGSGSTCTATVIYTPAANFNGSDSFTFKANDGTADSNTASVSITVDAVNDAPVANSQSVATNEDAPVTVVLTATDVDNSNLTFSIVANPTSGTLSTVSTPNCTANGAGAECTATVTYSSGANFSGSDTFGFKVSDGSLDSNVATVSVAVNAVNDVPVAANDFYSTDKDTVFSIGAPGVLGNDNDLDTQASGLAAVLVSAPTNAANFTLNPDGSFTYTPSANFAGTDNFTYKTGDGVNESNEATVTIAVLQADNAPVATNDFYNTEKETALNILARGVLANDNDADTPAANLISSLVSGPAHAASFSFNPDGSFDYAPQANFTGADSFTYKTNDGTSESNEATVTIAVIAPNTFPVAKNDSESTNEDTAKSIPASGVLGNDSIALLTAPTAVLVSGPTRALSFALNADGSFNYTPRNDFYGSDNFSYRIFDGSNYSNVAMVNIDVAAVNDPPTAQSQSVSTNENTPVIVTLSASDIDSQTLSFNMATPPSHGSLGNISAPNCTIQGQGVTCTATVTYTPAGNYFGPDSFTFSATDGSAASAPATVSITVIQVNHPPTANAGGPYTGTVGVPVQFNGSGNDPDGNPITFSWTFGDGGTGSGPSPTYTYSAPGTFTVTLTVTDSFGASAISQTTATINPALVLNPIGNKTVNLGETLTFTVSATSGTGGAPVSLYVAPLPLMTNASFNASTGVFTFRPSTTQVGSYQLTFSAISGSNTASETITIMVPQPPPGGTTGVRGLVHNLNNTPLANVKVTLRSSGHTAFTGADGFFTITGIPSGTQQLIVNGREANLGVYAIIAVAVELIDGVVNDLSGAISLPDVDVDAEVQVSPTFNTTVTNPSLPGVELEIIGGSATNPDGTPFTGKLSINPVPDYGRPESRPEELRPGFAVTIQPAGIRFNPPARITFPNADGMAPGNDLNLWSLSPDTGKFNIVGKSAVSADGQSIITVEGGVTASAWHFPLATSTTSNPSQGNNYCGSCRTSVGSEANLEEGSLFIAHALPSYRSLGQSRSLSLTYSSVTADPRPIISLDSTLGVRAAVPNTFSTRLKVGGVQQGAEIFTNSISLPEDADSTSRISVQFDGATLATGRYPFEATVFSNYLNSSVGGISTGNVIVVNRSDSALGAGWAITDLQQLHLRSSGDVLLVSGDGTALFFSGGPDTFTSPAREFSTLGRNSDATYTRTFKDGTKIHFSSQGLQTSVVDRNGNTTNFIYDGGGRLVTVTDPVGLATTLTYNAARLQRITDPAGRQTHFQFDGAGNLTRITNPDSSFVTYAYDGKGHLVQATNERGLSTTYAYDFAGRFAQATRPTGESRALISSKLRGLADTAGGQGTPTSPAPIVTSSNAAAGLTDGRGNQSRFMLDALGQVISQTDALGQTTTTVRDANGLPTKITRPNGAVTTMTYDAKGNLLTSTDAIGATTVFTYEPIFNQVKTIRDPKGNVTTVNYDTNGNPIEIIDALNNRAQMIHDSRGLLLSVTSAVGTSVQMTTSFTYDARGNLLTATNPKGDVTTLAYDSSGNVSTSTDAESRVTQFTYDTRNRLITVLDADLKTTQYGYDPRGNLIQVRDAKNQTTTFIYDGLDRLASATNPLGSTEIFAYDGNGNLDSTTNRNGQTITFNYDALNRLISKTRPPTSSEVGDQATTYSYDSVGNLINVTNPTIGVFNQYDAANRLISTTSTTESALASSVVPINVDTTIGANNFQFEGRTLQVNGRTLTVNGQHTFANIVLLNGAVLTHSPTTGSAQGKLDITVTGVIQVDNTSRIDVSGLGYLGANKAGNPFVMRGMTAGFLAGSSERYGGGYGGLGGNYPSSGFSNSVYGDFRNPDDVGSGGATLSGDPSQGGNGGGLVRIVAQAMTLNGVIRANGEIPPGFAAGGSGGGIRIDVGTLSGTGSITANGSAGNSFGGGGGGGRVAIYYQSATGFNFANVLAQGGTGSHGPGGGAGTIYLQGPARESGELIVDNNGLGAASLSTPIAGASTATLSLTHLRVRRAARVRVDGLLNLASTLEIATTGELIVGNRIVADSISLAGNSVLTQLPTTGSTSFKLDITAQSLTIDATSRIDVDGKGFLGAGQVGNPFGLRGMTLGFSAGSNLRFGGGYGGLGGTYPSTGFSNPVYGDFRNPTELGSGGSSFESFNVAGNGGGLVRILAQTLTLNGVIRANGGTATVNAAGGSGGGIRIDVETLSGTGSVTANGGAGFQFGGGGGGGRVAIYYQNATGFDFTRVNTFGGNRGGVGAGEFGAAGTTYLQGPARESGELIVDNNNLAVPSLSTPIPGAPATTILLTHLRVRRAARVRVDSTLNITEALELANSGEVAASRIFADTLTLTGSSALTHLLPTGTTVGKLDIHVQTLAIDATSRIDVDGRGFLGAGQVGNPHGLRGMTIGFAAGSNLRFGGGYGGLGGTYPSSGFSNPAYGDFRNPNEVGSGGSSFESFNVAGNGGGLIRIVAQTLTLNGVIRANGGASTVNAAGGSGGGIRIDVETLSGTGSVAANGGAGFQFGGGGGGGRVAIYYQNATGFDFSRVTAPGGPGAANNAGGPGGAGTTYLQGPARENGELVVDNSNLIAPNDTTPIFTVPAGPLNLTTLKIRRGAKAKADVFTQIVTGIEVATDSRLTTFDRVLATTIQVVTRSSVDAVDINAATTFQIEGNSVVGQPATTGSILRKLLLSADSLFVDATSRIDVSGLGYLGANKPGNPFGVRGMTAGFAAGSTERYGGAYGGLGGSYPAGGFSNPVYGEFRNPNDVGSGGATLSGDISQGGNGGGLMQIVAQAMTLNGVIRANGGIPPGFAAGGSGGGIRIDVGALSGAGSITANGSAGNSFGGGGGGGRIAIYYQSATGFNFANVLAQGGVSTHGTNGGAGTVHIEQQMAMLVPTVEDAPVMRANAGTGGAEHTIRFVDMDSFKRLLPASQDRPQQRLFDLSILDHQFSILENQGNLYLAMVAEGKLKPFASTSVTSSETGVSELMPDACCLLPGAELAPHDSPLTPDDLDPIYAYDLNGNRISMIDPTGLTTYAYDALNRLTSITNNKSQITTFAYDALSRRTSMTHANGVVTTYTYDSASQLTRLAHQFGATSINSFDYTYDKVGNRKTKTSRDGAHDYTYDTVNRLTAAVNPLPTNPLETFNYDPVGNRTNSNQNGASIFNPANQLLEDANFNYQYDNNGNTARKTAKVGGGITTYEYDAENKLVRVVSPSNTANYRYDGLGRRVNKEVIASTTAVTKYVYDNEDILLELNGSNQIVARYTHGAGIDEPLIMEKNSQSFYYHADGLGSITELTTQSGTVAQRYTYSSFGKIESQLDANFVQPYTFAAREVDIESGLHYVRNRYYDSASGRFIGEDPKGFAAGVNFYSYVGGNPIGRVDPYGLDWLTDVSNFSAGAGDYLSGGFMNAFNLTERLSGRRAIPISELLRKELVGSIGLNDIVDQCSASYTAGKYTGVALGVAIAWSAGLNGGANSWTWAGFKQGAKAIAEQGGTTIGKTQIGGVLDALQHTYGAWLPDVAWQGIWGVASATFVGNATGVVHAVVRNAGWVWNNIEKPLLVWRNIPIVPQ